MIWFRGQGDSSYSLLVLTERLRLNRLRDRSSCISELSLVPRSLVMILKFLGREILHCIKIREREREGEIAKRNCHMSYIKLRMCMEREREKV